MRNIKDNLIGIVFLSLGLSAVAASTVYGQVYEPEAPAHVSVCELIDHPSRYDNKSVSVRANVLDGMGNGILLLDRHCEKGLTLLAAQGVREQEDYKEFERAFYSARRNGGQRITARFEGRFSYRRAEPRLKWEIDVVKISEIAFFPRNASQDE